MGRWLAGILATIIAGVAIYYLTTGLENGSGTTAPRADIQDNPRQDEEPPAGNPSPRPDFLLTLEKLTYCEGDDKTPVATFRFENTGDTTFVYVLTKIIDVQTSADIYGRGDGFSSTGFLVDSDTCGVFDKATLVPGDVAYKSYALGSPNSIESRHTARATVTLCTRPAPDFGNCVERRVDFTLYYP